MRIVYVTRKSSTLYIRVVALIISPDMALIFQQHLLLCSET